MELGVVGRDPWYDFGSFPGRAGDPNRAAQERMLAHLALAGARWVRIELHCGDDPTTDTAAYDDFINTLAPRYGIRVLVVLSFGLLRDHDPLALAQGPFEEDREFGGGVSAALRRWMQRATSAASRWQHRVAAYEILNEQNRLPPGGVGFPVALAARLHTKFFRLITQLAKSWPSRPKVILGGLHPAGSGDPLKAGWVTDLAYLRGYYESEAFQSYRQGKGAWPLDGIGYHPYPHEILASLRPHERFGASLVQVERRLNEVASLRDQYDPRRPLWITELGYNAGYGRQNRAGQAAFLADSWEVLAGRGDVETLFWFKYEDFPPAAGPDAQRWGLVTVPFSDNVSSRGGAAYDLNADIQIHPAFGTFRSLAQR